MTDVDRLDLLARIGICFKIGAEGSFGVATQGKGCFLCSTNRIWQKPYLSDVCSCKEFFKFRATADRHCYLAWLKKRSVGNTRLLPHANMPLVPMNCFLCRVDYALEENVLTEQMWISGYGYIYHFLLMLPFNIFSQCDANVPEIVPQEYPGTSTQLPKPEDLEPFQHPATLSTQRYILGDRFHSS